ncbi:MAG: molybdopterin-binding/glycosyltransferase family 2 protein [Alphaproteobacteria bacterium]|nr:molybdopterin-binding/glycosyltransferase family 2 protein [Alphaproteobacteria bacterium]
MKFGDLPVAEAAGAILAHSLRIKKGVIRKGRVLTDPDVSALIAAGYDTVVAARLEPGDLDENAAAARVAAAIAGDELTASAAATGRVNLYAGVRAVAEIDADRIARINAVDEALTVATVAPYALVEPGQAVATVKVITFGLPERQVDRAAALAGRDRPAVRLAALKPKRVALIQTTLPGGKDSLLEKARATTEARLSMLGTTLIHEGRCPHQEEAVAGALRTAIGAGSEIILVMGASAITDRRDVVPAAIVAAGGQIAHFGMPVDPGNLTLLARLGDAWVLGLPGSARSPRLHGFDWILHRLLADIPVTGSDLAAMGVGGLLKDVPGRPLPREKAAPPPATARPPQPARVAALILAAGQSRRMGAVNKLLAEVDGVPMVARVADAVLAGAADPVVVVTGHEADQVRAVLAGRALRMVHNPDYEEGLSTSLKAGLAALPPEADGVLVCLGDMPRVSTAVLDRLIAAFDPAQGRAICVPVYHGKRGNPVLWARRFFAEMQAVAGDVGARHLIGEHADQVAEVEMSDSGVLIDVDSPEALAEL